MNVIIYIVTSVFIFLIMEFAVRTWDMKGHRSILYKFFNNKKELFLGYRILSLLCILYTFILVIKGLYIQNNYFGILNVLITLFINEFYNLILYKELFKK